MSIRVADALIRWLGLILASSGPPISWGFMLVWPNFIGFIRIRGRSLEHFASVRARIDGLIFYGCAVVADTAAFAVIFPLLSSGIGANYASLIKGFSWCSYLCWIHLLLYLAWRTVHLMEIESSLLHNKCSPPQVLKLRIRFFSLMMMCFRKCYPTTE